MRTVFHTRSTLLLSGYSGLDLVKNAIHEDRQLEYKRSAPPATLQIPIAIFL